MSDESVLKEEDGYRVRLVQDTEAEEPDSDGQGDVMSVEWRSDGATVTMRHSEEAPTGLMSEITWAYRRLGVDHDLVGRYLRMFHDVVSFDYTDWDDGTLLCVVTREHAEKWGCTPFRQEWCDDNGESIPAPAGNVTIANPADPFGSPSYDGPADDAHTRLIPGAYRTTNDETLVIADQYAELAGQALSVWRQWREGDIWGYVIEQQVSWTTDSPQFDDRETWEQVDALWGMYGASYAEEEALSAFNHGYAEQETETAK